MSSGNRRLGHYDKKNWNKPYAIERRRQDHKKRLRKLQVRHVPKFTIIPDDHRDAVFPVGLSVVLGILLILVLIVIFG